MADLKKMFLDFARENGLETEAYEGPEGTAVMRIRFSGQHGVFLGSAVFGEEDLFVFLVSMKLQVEKSDRARLLEKLTSVNQRLKLGGFYIDEATGVLGYRLTHYILAEDEENRTLLASLTLYAGRAAEKYYPEFKEILSENKDALSEKQGGRA